MAAVFDGHCGRATADQAAQQLPALLHEELCKVQTYQRKREGEALHTSVGSLSSALQLQCWLHVSEWQCFATLVNMWSTCWERGSLAHPTVGLGALLLWAHLPSRLCTHHVVQSTNGICTDPGGVESVTALQQCCW